jgi:LuxR family maltose regulon positive regulatory protein
LNEIAECRHEVFLFVDEFERLNSRLSIALVSRLLRYAPPNLHLIFASRRKPDLPLAALAVEEQLLTLDSDALRFTLDDAQTFFAQTNGARLDRVSVEMLNGATEGWVTGLQLAALALRESDDAAQLARDLAANRFGIDSYLDGTVFSQLPREILQSRFARRSSIECAQPLAMPLWDPERIVGKSSIGLNVTTSSPASSISIVAGFASMP